MYLPSKRDNLNPRRNQRTKVDTRLIRDMAQCLTFVYVREDIWAYSYHGFSKSPSPIVRQCTVIVSNHLTYG